MRIVFLLLVAVAVLSFVSLPHAGSQKPADSPIPPPVPVPSVEPPVLSPNPTVPLAPPTELQKLRERYLELAKKHGEILKEPALQAWIGQVEKRVIEDQASHELSKVREALQEIVKKYPESTAAGEARQMLASPQPWVRDY